MPEDRNESERLGGEFMIQDRDHQSGSGQMGGEGGSASGRQPEQGQDDSRQQGRVERYGASQQGGERRQQ